MLSRVIQMSSLITQVAKYVIRISCLVTLIPSCVIRLSTVLTQGLMRYSDISPCYHKFIHELFGRQCCYTRSYVIFGYSVLLHKFLCTDSVIILVIHVLSCVIGISLHKFLDSLITYRTLLHIPAYVIVMSYQSMTSQ